VAASISLFVSFEMGLINSPRRLGLLAAAWYWALVAMLWMEGVIYVAMEVAWAMKPRASTYEDTPSKPFWTVVASGSTAIRGDVVITIGTFRRDTDVDADLGSSFRDDYREAACSNSG
jgi:hypothetical protein